MKLDLSGPKDDTPWSVDRIDKDGNIREHLTRDGERTICGFEINLDQDSAGNVRCKRCFVLSKEAR